MIAIVVGLIYIGAVVLLLRVMGVCTKDDRDE